jgi:hypothetical protein
VGSFLNRRPATYRYLVVYDSVDDDKIYGIMKLGTKGIKTGIRLQFFNDDGLIDLSIREIPRVEWETMDAFELFPILAPYYRDPVVLDRVWQKYALSAGAWKDKYKTTIFKVRFRDY